MKSQFNYADAFELHDCLNHPQVFKSIPYCIQLAGGPYIETHKSVVDAFRPPQDKRGAKP